MAMTSPTRREILDEEAKASRRQFLIASGSAAAAVLGLGLYTWRIEPHWVKLERRRMPLPNLPPGLVGKTLLQVSDMHVGPRVDSGYLIESLQEAARLRPDFVVFTGDFISYRDQSVFDELARVLSHAPRGGIATVASLGNHDFGVGWRDLVVARRVGEVVAGMGARVLRNEHVALAGLQLVGLGDYWSPDFRPARDAILAADRAMPTVTLCHNPDALDEPIWGDLRGWVLAGHTHGGQCKPPFLPPPLLPVRNRRYTAGVFDVGPGRTLYINRGLGHLIRVRFNVRPEMTLFTLERAA